MSAPASHARMISVAVPAPATQSRSCSFAYSMTRPCVWGETRIFAPARLACAASFVLRVVPAAITTPIGANFCANRSMSPNASGVVSVTSRIRIPFAANASATDSAAATLFSRTTPMICSIATFSNNSLRDMARRISRWWGWGVGSGEWEMRTRFPHSPHPTPHPHQLSYPIHGSHQQGDQRSHRQARLLRAGALREDDQSREDLRQSEARQQGQDDLDVDGDRPHALLRLHADGARHDRWTEGSRAALHRAGPGVLRRHAQARAARRGWRGVRGRLAVVDARFESRQPREPEGESSP